MNSSTHAHSFVSPVFSQVQDYDEVLLSYEPGQMVERSD
jgi:hypothetical protein